MITLQDIERVMPCSSGMAYIKSQPTLLDAWNNCEDSNWLWWAVGKFLNPTKEQSVAYTQACMLHIKHMYITNANYNAAYAIAAHAAHAAAYAADATAAHLAAIYAANAAAAAPAYKAEKKWQCEQIRKIIQFNG